MFRRFSRCFQSECVCARACIALTWLQTSSTEVKNHKLIQIQAILMSSSSCECWPRIEFHLHMFNKRQWKEQNSQSLFCLIIKKNKNLAMNEEGKRVQTKEAWRVDKTETENFSCDKRKENESTTDFNLSVHRFRCQSVYCCVWRNRRIRALHSICELLWNRCHDARFEPRMARWKNGEHRRWLQSEFAASSTGAVQRWQ